MDLIEKYRTFHPKAEYTFLSNAHETFSRVNHNKFKNTQIILNIFSDPNSIKLEISYKKKKKKLEKNTWKLNNMLPNNHRINREIKEEIKKNSWRHMKMKTEGSKISEMQQKQF